MSLLIFTKTKCNIDIIIHSIEYLKMVTSSPAVCLTAGLEAARLTGRAFRHLQMPSTRSKLSARRSPAAAISFGLAILCEGVRG